MPTEAEWEYAARGGNKSNFHLYSGDYLPDNVAWFYKDADFKTHAVGMKRPNELGIYDMSGNVWEWCQDWFDSYDNSPQTNPTGAASGTFRMCRGGSFTVASDGYLSTRAAHFPDYRTWDLGLRLALSE